MVLLRLLKHFLEIVVIHSKIEYPNLVKGNSPFFGLRRPLPNFGSEFGCDVGSREMGRLGLKGLGGNSFLGALRFGEMVKHLLLRGYGWVENSFSGWEQRVLPIPGGTFS